MCVVTHTSYGVMHLRNFTDVRTYVCIYSTYSHSIPLVLYEVFESTNQSDEYYPVESNGVLLFIFPHELVGHAAVVVHGVASLVVDTEHRVVHGGIVPLHLLLLVAKGKVLHNLNTHAIDNMYALI